MCGTGCPEEDRADVIPEAVEQAPPLSHFRIHGRRNGLKSFPPFAFSPNTIEVLSILETTRLNLTLAGFLLPSQIRRCALLIVNGVSFEPSSIRKPLETVFAELF